MKTSLILYTTFYLAAIVGLTLLSGCASTNSSTSYDPLYFNSSDRTKVKYANTSSNSHRKSRSEATLNESRNDDNVIADGNGSDYYKETPAQYLPSNQANVGHSNTQQGSTGGGDTYINNYYDSYQQKNNRRNHDWWHSNTMFFVNAAPAFYTPIVPMRRNMWWGRPSISVGIGWNSFGGWSSGVNWGMMTYNPWYYSPAFGWYDPFYSYFGYYDPFWYGSYNWGWQNYYAWHSPYRNFYQVNNNYYYGNNNSGGGNNGDLGGGRILPAQPRGGRGGYATGIDNNLPGGRVGTNNGGGRMTEGTTQEPISGGRIGRGNVPDRYAPSTNTSSYGSHNATEYARPTRGTRGIENNYQNSNTPTYNPSYETGRAGAGRVPQQNYQPPQEQETMFQQQQRQSRSSSDDFFSRPSRNESFSSPRGGGGSFSTPSGGGGGGHSGGGRGGRGGG